MFKKGYSNHDLLVLTEKARTLWEYDFSTTPKKIKRRRNVVKDSVPLQAIYRMVVEDWASGEFIRLEFPFVTSNFAKVLGMSEKWDIPFEDRKFIEKDFVLFASDGKTILIAPNAAKRWWETARFNIIQLFFAIVGFAWTAYEVFSAIFG